LKETLILDHSPNIPPSEEVEDENEIISDVDLTLGGKETFVIEVDDLEDIEVASILLDPPVPEDFDVCNTERMPGVSNLVNNLQVHLLPNPVILCSSKSSFADVFPCVERSAERRLHQGILSNL
jgi:hypothetical protein